MAIKNQVEENTTRLIALQVIVILALIFFWKLSFLSWILTIDFGIRAFTALSSPTAFLAKGSVKLFKLKRKPIFAPPKKFAAAIGFVFSGIITILLFSNLHLIAAIVAGILAIFASLEAFFAICAGCYVYNYVIAPIVNKEKQNQ